MMIHAYQETYLSKAQSVLGTAFDYAVNSCKTSGEDFVKLFVSSSIGRRMENGDPAVISGKSGIEIVREIMFETTGEEQKIEPNESFSRSKEYWIGWAAAYYQWYSGRSYREIFKAVSYEQLEKLYFTLHEADISKFSEIIDKLMKEYSPETNLKKIRLLYGLSQSELAEKSGVSLRSIQMYEQRNKDINKACAVTVYRMAKVLGCSVEDLIEK